MPIEPFASGLDFFLVLLHVAFVLFFFLILFLLFFPKCTFSRFHFFSYLTLYIG